MPLPTMDGNEEALVAATVDFVTTLHGSRRHDSSATWTSSNAGDMNPFSDADEIEDRGSFVAEYNRLAKKNRIRLLAQVDCGRPIADDGSPNQQQKRGWISQTFHRVISSGSHAGNTKSVRKVSSKRSLSDIANHLMHPKRDGLKDEDLQTLVRLCGKSKLYLPSEYAPASLVLPTCFRATAQYLVQHGTETRSIFRNPGQSKIVSGIYDHYCPTQEEACTIDTTVSSPNLPSHLNHGVHDVASVFKKFLSGLPGGILGSLTLFDALVAIYSQLYGDTESTRTKLSKLRARMIALAIGTVKSQYRRELVCAVFGVLSLIGRKAETAPREDEWGRPLPTTDLMGYGPLAAVFGPLLVGDLLETYTMRVAHPDNGLILLSPSPPKSRKGRSGRRGKAADEARPRNVEADKVHVASAITEMVITHWREVVTHLRSLSALRTESDISRAEQCQRQLRPSASESFVLRQPRDWNKIRPNAVHIEGNGSPVPRRRSSFPGLPAPSTTYILPGQAYEKLHIQRKRPKLGRVLSGAKPGNHKSLPILSPTAEEPGIDSLLHMPRVDSGIDLSSAMEGNNDNSRSATMNLGEYFAQLAIAAQQELAPRASEQHGLTHSPVLVTIDQTPEPDNSDLISLSVRNDIEVSREMESNMMQDDEDTPDKEGNSDGPCLLSMSPTVPSPAPSVDWNNVIDDLSPRTDDGGDITDWAGWNQAALVPGIDNDSDYYHVSECDWDHLLNDQTPAIPVAFSESDFDYLQNDQTPTIPGGFPSSPVDEQGPAATETKPTSPPTTPRQPQGTTPSTHERTVVKPLASTVLHADDPVAVSEDEEACEDNWSIEAQGRGVFRLTPGQSPEKPERKLRRLSEGVENVFMGFTRSAATEETKPTSPPASLHTDAQHQPSSFRKDLRCLPRPGSWGGRVFWFPLSSDRRLTPSQSPQKPERRLRRLSDCSMEAQAGSDRPLTPSRSPQRPKRKPRLPSKGVKNAVMDSTRPTSSARDNGEGASARDNGEGASSRDNGETMVARWRRLDDADVPRARLDGTLKGGPFERDAWNRSFYEHDKKDQPATEVTPASTTKPTENAVRSTWPGQANAKLGLGTMSGENYAADNVDWYAPPPN